MTIYNPVQGEGCATFHHGKSIEIGHLYTRDEGGGLENMFKLKSEYRRSDIFIRFWKLALCPIYLIVISLLYVLKYQGNCLSLGLHK